MRKIKTLIGQDVLSLEDGHRIASVKRLVVDDAHHRLSALVVKDRGLTSDAQVVPIEAVRSFGPDAVVITKDDAVVSAPDAPDIQWAMDRDGTLLGRKVFSAAGQSQGKIVDAYFDEETRDIVGYDVSTGLMDDLASGPRFLPVDAVERIGDDVVYVRAEAIEALRAQGRPQNADAASGGSPEGDGAEQTPASEEGLDLVGRRVGTDVTDEQGGTVLATGERIAEEHVERARKTGNLEPLRAAAAAGAEAERQRVVGGAVEQAMDGAGSLWDRFTRALTQMAAEDGQRMSAQQARARLAAINDAVGRPVTKVILDRSDDVILNLGDIVTHEAVQRAHDADMLDTLLASVYSGDVAFDRDEMRAPSEATSSVEKASGGAAVVDELHEHVTAAEQRRRDEAEQRRRADDEARDRREAERQERAQARDDAARRAAAGEPEPTLDAQPTATSASSSGQDDGKATRSDEDEGAADAADRLEQSTVASAEAIALAQGDPPTDGGPGSADEPTREPASTSKGGNSR